MVLPILIFIFSLLLLVALFYFGIRWHYCTKHITIILAGCYLVSIILFFLWLYYGYTFLTTVLYGV